MTDLIGIPELRRKKFELEKEIASAIGRFRLTTGVEITMIDIALERVNLAEFKEVKVRVLLEL